MNKIVVVIPAFNPEMILVDYINSLLKEGFEKFIIVDDGSSPETAPVFEEIKKINECKVLIHEKNRGKGAALKTAFNFFLNSSEFIDYIGVVTADADGQHSPLDTLAVAKSTLENSDNFVLGVRDFESENVPFKSKKGNKITRFVIRLLFSQKITDTQTGLRGLNRKFIKNCLSLKGDRFEYEINMLISGMRSQKIVEVPIETIYFNQNRASSFKAIKDSVKIYSCIFYSFFMFCFSSISSSIIDLLLFNIFTLLLIRRCGTARGIFISTIMARILSSIYNYTINRKIVFKEGNFKNTIIKYYMLVVMVMFLSATFVTAIYTITEFNKSVIKIVIDTLLFILSYKVQQGWIFTNQK